MTTELARPIEGAAAKALELVVMKGDLSALNAQERLEYVAKVCDSIGLNPLTRPFDYLNLNGKLTLYARKDATEQLRRLRGVAITRLETTKLDDVYCVTAYAQDSSGRTDVATGAVAIGNMRGDNLANALMKAETKAKRRVTLSICGLGMLDEAEVESIPGAVREPLDEAKVVAVQPQAPAPKPEPKPEPPPDDLEAQFDAAFPESKPEPVKREHLVELGELLGELDYLLGKKAESIAWPPEIVRKILNARVVAASKDGKPITMQEAMNRAFILTNEKVQSLRESRKEAAK